jgi:hypothetical protein
MVGESEQDKSNTGSSQTPSGGDGEIDRTDSKAASESSGQTEVGEPNEKDSRSPEALDKIMQNLEPKVLRTVLDTDNIVKTGEKLSAERDERLREQIESQPKEPFKPSSPVSNYRKALKCGVGWDEMERGERVRFCNACKLQVYDLNKMAMPEVEELIFQRENKKEFVLYKRPDGKFLTRNCPVAIKRCVATAAVLGSGVLLMALITVLAMVQSSSVPTVSAVPQGEAVPGAPVPTKAYRRKEVPVMSPASQDQSREIAQALAVQQILQQQRSLSNQTSNQALLNYAAMVAQVSASRTGAGTLSPSGVQLPQNSSQSPSPAAPSQGDNLNAHY